MAVVIGSTVVPMSDRPSPRQRLLEAAIEAIDVDGEAGVRTERIAEVADVAKPSIYRYFHDRDGLIVAAQAERYRRGLHAHMMVTLEQVIGCDTAEDFAELLAAMMRTVSGPEARERRRLRVQVLGSAATRPALQEAIRAAHLQTVDEVSKAIGYAQRRGWISDTFAASALVEWWLAYVLGRHVVEEYGRDSDAEAVSQIMAAVVFDLIAPRPLKGSTN